MSLVRKLNWRAGAVAALAATMVFAVACGDSGSSSTPTSTPTSSGGGATTPTATTPAEEPLSGSLNLEGSSTVAPYTRRAIEAFEALHDGVTVTTGELGSGGGITAFINKEVPIAASSRPIRENEIGQAAQNGLTVHETVIAWDAVAIVVHPSNPVTQLTFEQFAQIFAGEITNWSEVGGPDLRIEVYTRNEESGTFAFVEELIKEALGSDAEYGQNVNKQASAPAGLTQVSNDPSGIFYAGLGNISDVPAGAVRVLSISRDASSPAYEPSEETVLANNYPVVRGLFYYSDGDPAESSDPLVKAWIAFVVSPEGQAIARELNLVAAH